MTLIDRVRDHMTRYDVAAITEVKFQPDHDILQITIGDRYIWTVALTVEGDDNRTVPSVDVFKAMQELYPHLTYVTSEMYMHTVSGDVANTESWESDFRSMDKESWFGMPIEECDGLHWLNDQRYLIRVTLDNNGDWIAA